jgi:hypothetical protein
MEGTYYLTKDEFPRLMLGRLKVEKPGVVVERPDKEGGFTNSAVIPLFAGQRMWLGWYGHELLWREYREDVRRRHDQLVSSSTARCPTRASGSWPRGLTTCSGTGRGDTPELWEKVNKADRPRGTSGATSSPTPEDGRRVGFWKRARPPPADPGGRSGRWPRSFSKVWRAAPTTWSMLR